MFRKAKIALTLGLAAIGIGTYAMVRGLESNTVPRDPIEPDPTPEPSSPPVVPSKQPASDTHSVSQNPSIPAGYTYMQQPSVTPPMATWASAVLHDAATYPMFSTASQVFDGRTILARVEYHPPSKQNPTVHRGVSLLQPVGA